MSIEANSTQPELKDEQNFIIDEAIEKYHEAWPQPTKVAFLKGLMSKTQLDQATLEVILSEKGVSFPIASGEAGRLPTRPITEEGIRKFLSAIENMGDRSERPLAIFPERSPVDKVRL